MQESAGDAVDTVARATRTIVGLVARSLAELGDEVTPAQYRVLVLVEGRGAQAMGELASALEVKPSTVTRMCDRLEEKALVAREVSEEDRRTVCVALTAGGRQLVDRVMRRRRELVGELLAQIDPALHAPLAEVMQAVMDAGGELSSDAWTLGWSVADG